MLPRTFFFSLLLSVLLVGCSTRQVTLPPAPSNPTQHLKNLRLAKQLPMPITSIERSKLQDTWGAARSHGRRHEGIDIFAQRGTKIYSVTDGIIVDLRNNNLGGKVIWIMGPENSWHYYAHLDRHQKDLKVGDYVRQGQHIAYVGNTGNAKHTAPHLHYGLYLQGKGRGAVNPYPYLR